MVTRVLAHRQLGLIFRHLGLENLDPDLDIYWEQYNIVITTMVGGRLVMGTNNEPVMHDNPGDLNDQLHNIATQTSNSTRTNRI